MNISSIISPRRTAQMMLAVIFTLGVITGHSVISLWTMPGSFYRRPRNKFIEDFSRTMNLNSDQRLMVEEIFRDANRQHREIRQRLQPQITEINARTNEKIRSLLSPSQTQAYNRWVREISRKTH